MPGSLQPVWLALGLSLGLLFVSTQLFMPTWATNDDFAMIASVHGTVLTGYASPGLVFSTVAWGHVQQLLHSVIGPYGYAVATLTLMAAAAGALAHEMAEQGLPVHVIIGIGTALFLPTMVYPQFTILAGYLSLTGLVLAARMAPGGSVVRYAFAVAFCFLGFIVRPFEFLVTLAVATPLLIGFYVRAKRGGPDRVALITLAALIGAVVLLNWHFYNSAEWQSFFTFTRARLPLIDFGGGRELLRRPDTYLAHGYSKNDVQLLSNWFLIDPKLANPQRILATLADLPGQFTLADRFREGRRALGSLFKADVSLFTYMAIGFAALAWRADKRVAAAAVLLVLLVFALGVLNRSGISRVYIPLLALVVTGGALASIQAQRGTGIHSWARSLLLVACCTISLWQLGASRAATAERVTNLQRDLAALGSDDLYVVWGAAFPYEIAFPLLEPNEVAQTLKLYGLMSLTAAPPYAARWEGAGGPNLIHRLRRGPPIGIFLTPRTLTRLAAYCRAHHRRRLVEAKRVETSEFLLVYVSCDQRLESLRVGQPSRKTPERSDGNAAENGR